MFHVCPLCNGMINPDFTCPNCSNPAIDCGKRNDYAGPYAPYEENKDMSNELYTDIHPTSMEIVHSEEEHCLHILYCEQCGTIIWIDGCSSSIIG
ncbi:hypothetical protein [Paenibacillus marinisediminis]